MHAWTVLFCLSLVVSQDIGIFTKNIDTAHEQDIGILSYDHQLHTSSYRAGSDISFENGHYSVCARDLDLGSGSSSGPVCFGYQEIGNNKEPEFGGEFQIFINSNGEIDRLSFVRGNIPSIFNSSVINVPSASKPNLTPFNKQEPQQQAQTQKVVRKKVVQNEKGEKVEVEEEVEVDNRSWVQKNWMYIVPPLVLFLIFSPDEKKEEST